MPTDFESRTWTEDRRNSYFPRRRGYETYSNSALGVNTDRYLQNAAYIRLKNITLGYTLPLKPNKAVEKVRFYVTGENLWLWTKYNGFDPDVSSEGTSSTLRRVDMGAYPRSRMFVFSIQLRY